MKKAGFLWCKLRAGYCKASVRPVLLPHPHPQADRVKQLLSKYLAELELLTQLGYEPVYTDERSPPILLLDSFLPAMPTRTSSSSTPGLPLVQVCFFSSPFSFAAPLTSVAGREDYDSATPGGKGRRLIILGAGWKGGELKSARTMWWADGPTLEDYHGTSLSLPLAVSSSPVVGNVGWENYSRFFKEKLLPSLNELPRKAVIILDNARYLLSSSSPPLTTTAITAAR